MNRCLKKGIIYVGVINYNEGKKVKRLPSELRKTKQINY